MATTPMPTYDRLMQPTLDALHALGGKASNQEIFEWIVLKLEIEKEVVERLHKPGRNVRELEYRLMWARTYLRKFGLIDSPTRSVWELSESGRETTVLVPEDIVQAVRRQYDDRDDSPTDDENPSDEKAAESEEPQSTAISPTPLFPTYAEVRHFLRLVEGTLYADYRDMINEIWSQVGSPQEQVDWTDPQQWIPERLNGKSAALALKLWQGSKGVLNPRYTRSNWMFATRHNLIDRADNSQLKITDYGRAFLEDEGESEAQIDQHEGVLFILRLVAERGPAKRGDLYDDYAEYCHTYTTVRSESVIQSYLYNRLRNLAARSLISARGQRYEITDRGLAYLKKYSQFVPEGSKTDEGQTDLHALAKQMRDVARKQLHQYLLGMDPFKFEILVQYLLENIGYTDVTTTSPTNDKGVDVIAQIELGITSVREVIQVKRHRGSINRVVLDQLRGSLHRFNAVRGTIITTGHFSKGALDAAFERGAAPITLIDGEKLLDLLMEYEIGVKQFSVTYYEFTPDQLAQAVKESPRV